MMNATASSTRLPRRMNALKPLMRCPLRGRRGQSGRLAPQDHGENGRDRRSGQRQGLRLAGHRDDDQRAAHERRPRGSRPGHRDDRGPCGDDLGRAAVGVGPRRGRRGHPPRAAGPRRRPRPAPASRPARVARRAAPGATRRTSVSGSPSRSGAASARPTAASASVHAPRPARVPSGTRRWSGRRRPAGARRPGRRAATSTAVVSHGGHRRRAHAGEDRQPGQTRPRASRRRTSTSRAGGATGARPAGRGRAGTGGAGDGAAACRPRLGSRPRAACRRHPQAPPAV